jgi:hypothetical protein
VFRNGRSPVARATICLLARCMSSRFLHIAKA